jgi:hypothetical protein
MKCNGHAVNLDVYFGFILLWQPNMQKTRKKSLEVYLETAAYT